ncbi:ABC transporter permease [Estrella lausannensis]|uniref:Transport permease protein n=1 Tax=Estrella lausannensis TaxID=483423 RepID=A0A0H5DST0_9BACT|nr:ABC transporter permease [Estrella lausannensis]CRX38864.1 ABC-2 type transporter [Estrella lausannensis]
MFSRIKEMILKEFIQIFRDPRMRSIIFVIPIFQIVIFGYAVTTDVNHIATWILDNDNSKSSRAVSDAFSKSGYFQIHGYLKNEREIAQVLDSGSALVVLTIPQGFQDKIESGEVATMQSIIDGTDSNTARIVSGYVGKIARGLNYESADKKLRQIGNKMAYAPIHLESRAWFNDNLESRNFYIPGIITTIVTLVTLTMTSMSIVREKEVGTMEQILVSPIKKIEFILGKTIPFSLIAYIDVILILTVATFWFEVPLRGSILLLFVAVTFYLFTILGIGFFISTISHTQQQAMMGTFFFYFPMVLLSGFLFPIVNMPDSIQWVTYINPLRYFISFIRSLFLKGVGLEILWPQIAALAIMGLGSIWLATKRFQKTLG